MNLFIVAESHWKNLPGRIPSVNSNAEAAGHGGINEALRVRQNPVFSTPHRFTRRIME
jgi:hypothetical protein